MKTPTFDKEPILHIVKITNKKNVIIIRRKKHGKR